MGAERNRGGRNCPATRGNPTSMTRGGWDKICAASRLEAKVEQDIESRTIMYKAPCLKCDGEVPAEVTIIELPQAAKQRDEDMAKNNKKVGVCTYCAEQRTVRESGEIKVCAMCDNMLSMVRQRPKVVLATLKDLAPELLEGGDVNRVEVLEQIGAGDELLAIREALQADDDEELVDVARRRMDVIARLEESSLAEAAALAIANVEVKGLRLRLENAGKDTPLCVSASCRQKMHDLALRLAIGVMKGEIEGISATDVELLRCVA